METKRCQRCHKLLRSDAQVCSRCGGYDFMRVTTATKGRPTVNCSPPRERLCPSLRTLLRRRIALVTIPVCILKTSLTNPAFFPLPRHHQQLL